MKEKEKYGILIRTKKIYMPSGRNVIKIFADAITFGDDGKPRNYNELTTEKDYQYFQNLGMNCFVDINENPNPYGIHVEYNDVYSVNQRIAHKMYKTLKKVNNKLAKYDAEFGRYKTFGEFVSRFAKSIGAKVIVFYKDYSNVDSNYTRNNFIEYKPGKAVGIIDQLITDMVDNSKHNY